VTTATLSAERVSDGLREALPRPNKLVDIYRHDAVWYEAILETLATIATVKSHLPGETRRMVADFINQPGVHPKFKRDCLYYLDTIT
jgi:hypothetical protein